MAGLSFVSLLAYDYRFLAKSLPSYYALADEIVLGLDCDRLTWMKQPFTIDLGEVRAFIDRIDVQKKIRIVEGDFHSLPHPMLNDTAERDLLSNACTPGNWIVQIDVDEVLFNGGEFKTWLLANNPAGRVVLAIWIAVFKVIDDHLLVVVPNRETTPVATKARGGYTRPRMTFQPTIVSPLAILHFSFGRTPQEMMQKLNNWGHVDEFDAKKFYDIWNSVTLENYTSLRNFHPNVPANWSSLKLMPWPEGVAR